MSNNCGKIRCKLLLEEHFALLLCFESSVENKKPMVLSHFSEHSYQNVELKKVELFRKLNLSIVTDFKRYWYRRSYQYTFQKILLEHRLRSLLSRLWISLLREAFFRILIEKLIRDTAGFPGSWTAFYQNLKLL